MGSTRREHHGLHGEYDTPPCSDAAVWLAIKVCETDADFRTTLRGCTQYLIDHGVGNAASAHLIDLDLADRHPRESPEPSLGGSEWEAIPAADSQTARLPALRLVTTLCL